MSESVEKDVEKMLEELTNMTAEAVAEAVQPAEGVLGKPKETHKNKKQSNWGVKKKEALNSVLIESIIKDLSEAWELMASPLGRKLIENVAKNLKLLIELNDLL